jgi:hypothetical protein
MVSRFHRLQQSRKRMNANDFFYHRGGDTIEQRLLASSRPVSEERERESKEKRERESERERRRSCCVAEASKK